MIGPDAEHAGIIRAGAEMVEAMATATVPKIVLTLNHASGAGYYAMGGQGFDPDFVVSLPTGRLVVVEGEDAAEDVEPDARAAAAQGFVDEILVPEEVRPALGLLISAARNNAGPHLGPFQIS
jgi:acetyl-CoA carboxylase carboxyltransferase component